MQKIIKPIIVFVILIAAVQISAQKNDKKIEEIQRIYQQTNEQIAKAEKNFAESKVFLTILNVNKGGTMYPAVGNYSSEIKFYYTYGDRDKYLYPNRLFKVTISTERSARTEYAEYIFDKTGQLIFYFGKEEEEAENRLYFASGKLIRFQTGEKIADLNNRETQETARNVLKSRDKLMRIFSDSLE